MAIANVKTLQTKTDFTWKRGLILETRIPAGAPVVLIDEGTPYARYYVQLNFFPANSLDRHDATYYGCGVAPSNVETA